MEPEPGVIGQPQKEPLDNAPDERAAGASEDRAGLAPPSLAARGPSFGAVVLAAVCGAVLGSVALGVCEYVLAVALAPAPSHGGWWPLDLMLAAGGRVVVTYLLFSLPAMVACGVIYWVFARRRTRAVPEAFFLSLYLVLVTVIVLPARVEMARRLNPIFVIPAIGVGLGLAAVVYSRTCRVHRRVGQKRLRRWFQVATGAAVVVALVVGFFFVRSPLFNPGTYCVAGGIPRNAAQQRPNILWVVLDTVRADRLGAYGYGAPTTPFLDQWAQQAIVFERAVANGMWTLPTHASMFTGLPVRQHGMGGPTTWLDDSFRTAAEVLNENGYETALFSNNPLLGPTTNLCQGFQTVTVPWEFLRTIHFSLEFFCERWGITPPAPWLDSGFGSALTNHLVAGWLDSHGGAPVCVFINYMEAHLPYLATKGYRQLFLSDDGVHRSYDLRRRAYGEIADFLTFDANVEGYEHVLPFDREVLKRQYDAAVRNLDDRVAELIDIFRRRGMLDNTLVVITADHGEHLETHNMWSHHFLLYDDLIHVPMMIRPPGDAAPRRVRTVVQLSDLYPTILRAVLGPAVVETPAHTRDLLEVAQEREQDRIAISHTFGAPPQYVDRLLNTEDPEIRHRAFSQTAAVASRFKYIESSDGRRELYDLAADPGELENLDSLHREESRRLEDYVASWLEAVPEYVPRAGDKPRIGPDVMELLKALGYVGDED